MRPIYHSFDWWKTHGRIVVKGQRSHRRNCRGIPLFSRAQTTILNPDGETREETHDVPRAWTDACFFSDGYMESVGDR